MHMQKPQMYHIEVEEVDDIEEGKQEYVAVDD